MVVRVDPAWMAPYSTLKVGFLSFSQILEWLTATNTLAYYKTELIMATKTLVQLYNTCYTSPQ